MSFRREYRVPKGGPDGGDGGPGGDVVLVADPDLRDLSAFQRGRRFKAGRGEHGGGANKSGAAGETVELRVPVGTQVFDEAGTILADLAGARSRAVAAAADAALRRDRPPRRGAHARAAAQADGGRGPRGASERGEVLVAAPDFERAAEGRRISVHDARARSGDRRRAG